MDDMRAYFGDFRMTAPTRDQLLNWIAEAWDYISEETIVSGFRKANVISATASADHVEQSVEIPASVSDTLISVLRNNLVLDEQICFFRKS